MPALSVLWMTILDGPLPLSATVHVDDLGHKVCAWQTLCKLLVEEPIRHVVILQPIGEVHVPHRHHSTPCATDGSTKSHLQCQHMAWCPF